MKKNWMLIVLLLCVCLVFSGCGKQETADSTAVIDGQEVVIDRENGTVTCGDDVYRFTVTGSGTSVMMIYPNGETYTLHYETGGTGAGYGSSSSGWTQGAYLDPWALSAALSDAQTARDRQGNPLIGFFVIVLGIFGLAVPKTAWYLSYGWRYKDAEPSDAALVAERVSGGVLVFIGLLLCFV